MNKRERIEKLEQNIKELNDIILKQQKHFDNELIDMKKYVLALCFIAKFKWTDIKNKQLREDTQWKALCDLNKNGTEIQMDYHLLHLMDTTRIEQVIDNPEKYNFTDIMKTYNYLQNILKKDKDISIYSKSSKKEK